MTLFDKDDESDSQNKIIVTVRKRRSHPLEWLSKHKNPLTGQFYINDDHMRIGESFAHDVSSLQGYYKSQNWADYIDHSKSNNNDYIDIKLQSKKRLYKALELLGEKQKIMIELCFLGNKLGETEKKFGLGKGQAKFILRQGLDCLRHIYY